MADDVAARELLDDVVDAAAAEADAAFFFDVGFCDESFAGVDCVRLAVVALVADVGFVADLDCDNAGKSAVWKARVNLWVAL